MKKVLLILFLVLDIVVIAVSAIYLMAHIKGTRPTIMNSIPGLSTRSAPVPAPTRAQTATSSSTDSAKTTVPPLITPTSTAVPASSRRILFTYRNSHAKKVMIRADFTGWRAEPMDKDAVSGIWRYMAVLEPGEYAYCYSVDDKSIRDPANKRAKTVGKTVVSSIVVQPPPGSQH